MLQHAWGKNQCNKQTYVCMHTACMQKFIVGTMDRPLCQNHRFTTYTSHLAKTNNVRYTKNGQTVLMWFLTYNTHALLVARHIVWQYNGTCT